MVQEQNKTIFHVKSIARQKTTAVRNLKGHRCKSVEQTAASWLSYLRGRTYICRDVSLSVIRRP